MHLFPPLCCDATRRRKRKRGVCLVSLFPFFPPTHGCLALCPFSLCRPWAGIASVAAANTHKKIKKKRLTGKRLLTAPLPLLAIVVVGPFPHSFPNGASAALPLNGLTLPPLLLFFRCLRLPKKDADRKEKRGAAFILILPFLPSSPFVSRANLWRRKAEDDCCSRRRNTIERRKKRASILSIGRDRLSARRRSPHV